MNESNRNISFVEETPKFRTLMLFADAMARNVKGASALFLFQHKKWQENWGISNVILNPKTHMRTLVHPQESRVQKAL